VRVRVVQAATIGLFALVMGVFWGTWFFLGRTWTTSPPDLAAVARPWGREPIHCSEHRHAS
jgi:hypothetical protein